MIGTHPDRLAGEASSAEHTEEVLPGWHERALDVVRRHAETHRTFHVDAIEWPDKDTAELRAAGAVMSAAVRQGIVAMLTVTAPDGEEAVVARRSRRSRGGLKPVWRSLVHREPVSSTFEIVEVDSNVLLLGGDLAAVDLAAAAEDFVS